MVYGTEIDMGYLKIPNLYKDQDILLFKEVWAQEKIDGTSQHVRWNIERKKVSVFPGGINYDLTIPNFDLVQLKEKFLETGLNSVVIYGEGYGGKCQGMSKTYGVDTKFVAFDVKIDNSWLSVPQADDFCQSFGIEFVDYIKIPTDLDLIDTERDRDSVQAIRNGMGTGHKREGVVLKPLIEVTKNNGSRIIAKHKRDDFRETKTPRKVNQNQLKVLKEAKEVADEWVTEIRLSHVLDKLQNPGIEHTKDVILSMINDVKIEGEGEIEWSKSIEKQIGKVTAQIFKKRLQTELYKIK